jgi:serine protease Do
MRVGLVATIAAIFMIISSGFAQAMPKPVLPPPVTVSPFPSNAKARPVKLVRAVIAMKDGEVWGHYGDTLCDANKKEFRWDNSRTELDTSRFGALFDEQAVKAHYPATTEANLFEDEAASDRLELGARVLDMRIYLCEVFGIRATATMKVEWQVYDRLKREVVAKVETVGGDDRKISSLDDFSFPLLQAFGQNAQALLADPTFRQVAMAASVEKTSAPTPTTSLILNGAKPDAARPIGEVSASVVALFAGNSMGSGFLVSDDGYILTNHHVIGAATKVRVRWSDGFETTGEVVRSDKRRDVALVKTEPRGRPPLALVRGTPAVGSSVYAVGTPIDASMLNTVTRGIISANRFMDGFAFIQSDVGVNSGNSGGPLLDEKGRVIGITVIKMFPGQGQQNLNLFIPIGDALDFLALKTSG